MSTRNYSSPTIALYDALVGCIFTEWNRGETTLELIQKALDEAEKRGGDQREKDMTRVWLEDRGIIEKDKS